MISPIRGDRTGFRVQVPLGHPEWWYITLFRAPLEHADGPADACGLPTALTGPASGAAVTGTLIVPVIPSSAAARPARAPAAARTW